MGSDAAASATAAAAPPSFLRPVPPAIPPVTVEGSAVCALAAILGSSSRTLAPPGAFPTGLRGPSGTFPSGLRGPSGTFPTGLRGPSGTFSSGLRGPPGTFPAGLRSPSGVVPVGVRSPSSIILLGPTGRNVPLHPRRPSPVSSGIAIGRWGFDGVDGGAWFVGCDDASGRGHRGEDEDGDRSKHVGTLQGVEDRAFKPHEATRSHWLSARWRPGTWDRGGARKRGHSGPSPC